MWPHVFAKVGASGELQGSITPVQCPDVACWLARFKARSSNVGRVYLGFTSAVSKPDGTTDTTTGFELAPGDDSGWLPIDNLNIHWRICDNVGDGLTYWAISPG